MTSTLNSPVPKALHLIAYSLLTYCIASKPDTGLIIHESYTPDRPPIISKDQAFHPLLHNSDLIIDKTPFLKAVLEDPSKVIFINCPRRWGKSVNLNMLKTFLSVQFDDKGNRLPLNATISYHLFIDGEVTGINGTVRLKKPPKISYHKRVVDKFMDKRPVIYLNLNSGSFSVSSMISDVYESLKKTFDDHIYILNSYIQIINDEKAYNYTKDHAREMQSFFYKYRFQMLDVITQNDVLEVLDLVTEALYEHFGEKIFVLIDECFASWSGMLSKTSFTEDDKSKFLKFYTDFMTAVLKDNVYVEKVILMDTIPIPQELRETAFSEATECNMLNGKFMEFFGINQLELNDLFTYLNIPQDTLRNVTTWYNGFKVNHQDLTLSNMISVTKFIPLKEYQYYSMTLMFVNNFVKSFLMDPFFYEKFRSLFTNQDIHVKLDHSRFTWKEYEIFLRTVNQESQCNNSLVPKAFMFLYHSGYLTLSENCNPDGPTYRFKLPNLEVKTYMKLLLDEVDRKRVPSTTAVPQIVKPNDGITSRHVASSDTKIAIKLSSASIKSPTTSAVISTKETSLGISTSEKTTHSSSPKKVSSSPSSPSSTLANFGSTKRTSLKSLVHSKPGRVTPSTNVSISASPSRASTKHTSTKISPSTTSANTTTTKISPSSTASISLSSFNTSPVNPLYKKTSPSSASVNLTVGHVLHQRMP